MSSNPDGFPNQTQINCAHGDSAHSIQPSFRGRTRCQLYFFLLFSLRARDLAFSDDMIPDLIRPSPSARQAGANRALEGAVTMADDAQSKAPGYCSVISLSVVVIRIRHLLRVGIRVKCLSRNVDRGGQNPGRRRSSGGGRGWCHHGRRMLGMRWDARNPSAACIGGR